MKTNASRLSCVGGAFLDTCSDKGCEPLPKGSNLPSGVNCVVTYTFALPALAPAPAPCHSTLWHLVCTHYVSTLVYVTCITV